jgi:hypothetical protein
LVTNKDINAKQQFEQLQRTLSLATTTTTTTTSVDTSTSAAASSKASTISSMHSSTQDLSNAECGGNVLTAATSSVNISDESDDCRDRVTTDIVTLLEQGWPSQWNKGAASADVASTTANGTNGHFNKVIGCYTSNNHLQHPRCIR